MHGPKWDENAAPGGKEVNKDAGTEPDRAPAAAKQPAG